ncbi:TerB family tellurite resistance protein [Parvularcula sp. IMCC14364]|uniref:TerB family tellurite resistance protein n=1 Tax=Parvularcula sp. IMCC14364 TaxID=3067902 RepID=UPI002741FD36|nr:TerB family tellurite resistance protein [Parvularcula sp. IMCC14364]
MGLLLLILGGLATAIFVASRVIGAARDGQDAIDDVKGAVRRGKWSRQIDQRVIENVNDPRDSAAILMVQIASYEGEITTGQKQKMIELMTEGFGATPDEAEGLYSFGRMAIGQINDAANSLGKLMRPVKDALTLQEMKDMIRMLEEVAEVEGKPSERQRDLIVQVRRALSLDRAYQA